MQDSDPDGRPDSAPTGPGQPPVRFDPSRAWSTAMALLSGNREVLSAIAGLFFLIPQLLTMILLPDVPQGLEGEAAAEAALKIFGTWWPVLIGSALVQAFGLMAMMALLVDRSRPTLGEAMRTTRRTLPAYIGATLVLIAGVGLCALLILLPLAMVGGEAGTALATVPILIAALWVNVRTLTLAPVIAVERRTNPFEALKRSWAMTAGNGARMLFFASLFVLVALIVSVVTTAIPGALLIAALGQDVAGHIVGVIEAFVSAIILLVWGVLLAACYRQLAG